MELEVVRCVATALADLTIGINAKLPGVPRDAGDPLPSDVTIYDSTRHGWVARREASVRGGEAIFPAVAVSIFKPAELDGEIGTVLREGTFDVFIEYVDVGDETELTSTAGLYTMRAAMRTLAEFHRNSNVSMRTRNDVSMVACMRLSQIPVFAPRADAIVTAALLATYSVRDVAPYS